MVVEQLQRHARLSNGTCRPARMRRGRKSKGCRLAQQEQQAANDGGPHGELSEDLVGRRGLATRIATFDYFGATALFPVANLRGGGKEPRRVATISTLNVRPWSSGVAICVRQRCEEASRQPPAAAAGRQHPIRA